MRIIAALLFLPIAACADSSDDSCLQIALTGTQGGPPAINGLAGAGTLVRYGSSANQCNDVQMQFDVGRGTTMRLSELGLSPNDIDAVFLTHLHSDHSEGLIGMMQLRWHFTGDELDLICGHAADDSGSSLSCAGFAEHIADPFVAAGEIQQRRLENKQRHAGGPSALINVMEVAETEDAVVVWVSGDVQVSAVSTKHIVGSLAYRVDTPAGSVVIGGDAGNSKSKPPRASSTSETVEALAAGADVLVHSAIHPTFSPDSGSTFPPIAYLRQSSAEDLGAMAVRAGVSHLVLTHLIPALDASAHGPFAVPSGALTESDFSAEVRKSEFQGEISIGRDLMSIRLSQ